MAEEVKKYIYFNNDYDYNLLEKSVWEGFDDFINSLGTTGNYGSKHRKDLVLATLQILNGIKDGSITYTGGRFVDSSGRVSNQSKRTRKDYTGLMATHIYNTMKLMSPYLEKTVKEVNPNLIAWDSSNPSKSLGLAVLRELFNGNEANWGLFDKMDYSSKINALKKALTTISGDSGNLFSKYFTGYDPSYTYDLDKLITALDDGYISNEDLMALYNALGEDYSNRFIKASATPTKDTKSIKENTASPDYSLGIVHKSNDSLEWDEVSIDPIELYNVYSNLKDYDVESNLDFLNLFNIDLNDLNKDSLEDELIVRILALQNAGKLSPTEENENILISNDSKVIFDLDSNILEFNFKPKIPSSKWGGSIRKLLNGDVIAINNTLNNDFSNWTDIAKYIQWEKENGQNKLFGWLFDSNDWTLGNAHDITNNKNKDDLLYDYDLNLDFDVNPYSGTYTGQNTTQLFWYNILKNDADIAENWAKQYALKAKENNSDWYLWFTNNDLKITENPFKNNAEFDINSLRFDHDKFLNWWKSNPTNLFTDSKNGSGHDVFKGKVHIAYTDDNNWEYIDPDNLSGYEQITESIPNINTGLDPTLIEHLYYKKNTLENTEVPGETPSVEGSNGEGGGGSEEGKPDPSNLWITTWNNATSFFKGIKNSYPLDWLKVLRAGVVTRANDRAARTLIDNTRVAYKSPINLQSPIVGDFASMLRAYQSAADLRRRATTPLTSDSREYRLGLLDANNNAFKYEWEGQLTDNKAIKSSIDRALDYRQKTLTYNTNVADLNRVAIADYWDKIGKIKSTNIRANAETLKGLLADIITDRDKKEGLYLEILKYLHTLDLLDKLSTLLSLWIAYRQKSNPEYSKEDLATDTEYLLLAARLKLILNLGLYNTLANTDFRSYSTIKVPSYKDFQEEISKIISARNGSKLIKRR